MRHRTWAWAWRWLRRAGAPGGGARQVLELTGKSTLAASASWYVAYELMGAQVPAFAPFSAVLIMQVTVYQSLLQALRFVAAVCAGVLVQAGLGFMAGPDLVTFALVALIALSIGRWRHLGPQESQVATAAFFAFSTFSTTTGDTQRVERLGQIVLLVVIGCTIGVAVNLLLWPPMRYRRAEVGIHALAGDLSRLMADIRTGMYERDLGEERARKWRQRAAETASLVDQARSALHTAAESHRYNPRRLLPHHRWRRDFSGYRAVVDALERVTHQLGSLTRTLHRWPWNEGDDECDSFLRDYADLLEALARFTGLFGEIDEKRLPRQAGELCEAAEAARHKLARLVERARASALPLDDPSRPYGILVAEAARLTEEAGHSCDILRHTSAGTRAEGQGVSRRSPWPCGGRRGCGPPRRPGGP